jgi:hypothetical protein
MDHHAGHTGVHAELECRATFVVQHLDLLVGRR